MNQKLNVIYPRKYVSNGEERVHWMHVGVAWNNEKGIDVHLWVLPVPDETGKTKLMLRTPDRTDEQRAQSYRERSGGLEPPQRGPQNPYGQYRPPEPQQAGQQAPQSRYEPDPGATEGQAEDNIPF